LAIFAITKTDGFLITPLSILVKVVYLTPYFLAKSSCDKPCFVRYFFIFYPMLSSLAIFSIILYYVIVILTISAFNIIITNKLKSNKENKIRKKTASGVSLRKTKTKNSILRLKLAGVFLQTLSQRTS
jgi:hypothetical protein